jgi:iron complex transport system substrate-binding protein
MRGPARIVCLTEETTEFLYLLGEEDRIVGISAYTVRPPHAKDEKPVVSAFVGGSLPKIIALKPDLVLGFSDVQADFAADLIRANLNVHIFNQRSVAEIIEAMRLLGRMICAEEKSEEIIRGWRMRIADSKARHAFRKHKPTVYFEEWDEPMLSGIQWVRELIEIAGGECLFKDQASGSKAEQRKLKPKDVVEADPDVILASWCGKPFDLQSFSEREGFSSLKALRTGRVHEIDSSIILQPGPAALTDGLDRLEALLHPGDAPTTHAP